MLLVVNLKKKTFFTLRGILERIWMGVSVEWVWDAIGFWGSSGEIVRDSRLQKRTVLIMFGLWPVLSLFQQKNLLTLPNIYNQVFICQFFLNSTQSIFKNKLKHWHYTRHRGDMVYTFHSLTLCERGFHCSTSFVHFSDWQSQHILTIYLNNLYLNSVVTR